MTTRELLVKINGDNSGLNNALIKTGQDLEAIKKNAKATSAVFSEFGKSMSTFVTLPILAAGAAAVKATADMEMQEAAFTTMLGSADKAAKMLNDIKVMAAATPFSTADLTDASKTLMQFGVNADAVLPIMRRLGDVSGGNAQRFQQLSLAFGQMSSAGRLMGQDLLQMINAGFNPLNEISKKTGESMAELKKRMESGGVSAQEVAQAFEAATSKGGMFFQGMERGSKTLAGQWSTLMDDVAELGRSFGEILLPILKDIVSGLSSVIRSFGGLDDEQKRIILVIAGIAAALGPLAIGLGEVVKAANTLKGVFSLASGPTGWIVLFAGALALVGVAIADNIRKQKEFDAVMAGTSKKAADEQIKMLELQLSKAQDYYKQVTAHMDKWSASEKKNQKAIVDAAAADVKAYQDRIDALELLKREQLAAEGTSSESNKDQIKLLNDGIKRFETEKKAISVKITELEKLTTPEITAALGESDAMRKLKNDLANVSIEIEKYGSRIKELSSPTGGLGNSNKLIKDGSTEWQGYANAAALAYDRAAAAAQNDKLEKAQEDEKQRLIDLEEQYKAYIKSIEESNARLSESFLAVSDGLKSISSFGNDKTSKTLSVFGDMFKGFSTGNVAEVASAAQALVKLSGAADRIGPMLDKIVPPLLKIVKLAADANIILTPGVALLNLAMPILEGLLSIIGDIADALAGFIDAGVESIKEFFKPVTDWIEKIAKGFHQWLVDIGLVADETDTATDSQTNYNKELDKTTKAYIQLSSAEGSLIASYTNIIDGIKKVNDVLQKFGLKGLGEGIADTLIKSSKEFKELSASYGESIGKTLGDGIVNGMSKVDFMAAIGKILINAMITAALATGPIADQMAAIGEKISYMVIHGFTDEGMAEIESMASNIYDTFSTGVLPIVQKIQDKFGTGASSTSSSDAVGSFASGVTNWHGGVARVGEQGPELVTLPRGSSVTPEARQVGGATFIFNSPKALSPMETKRQYQQQSRRVAFETGGNL